jgi:hypothetical protein
MDTPGHESARLFFRNSSWYLAGTAVFGHNERPCRLGYVVVCTPKWQTVRASVEGWVGEETVEIEISVDPKRRWSLNGKLCPEVNGCIDLDLNFSPSTNLLPIRRLGLNVGQEASVKAAWLRFPEFILEPLEQVYHRIGPSTYRYTTAGGTFIAELTVNDAGFVIEYPGFWTLVAVA